MENKNNRNVVRGFKVFNPDWTCSPCGNTKQYACPGKFEENGDITICRMGMHFCENAADCFDYYKFDSRNKVAEVIAYGKVVKEGNKSCTDKLEIVREIPWEEVLRSVNTGKNCTGIHNSGDNNTGNWNTGNWNTGDRNTGDCNTGDCNTGDWNVGNWNVGNCNTGNWNAGDRNTGDWNAGDWNVGDNNTGNWNTGDWNNSSRNAGCFSTEEQEITMFNKKTNWTYTDWLDSAARRMLNSIPRKIVEWVPEENMSELEKKNNIAYATTGGFLKVVDGAACAQEWWDGLCEDEKDTIKGLPNFDPEIFYECTGIHVGNRTGTRGLKKEE